MKPCVKCGAVKPLSAFYADRRNKVHGKQGRCKDCWKASYTRAWSEQYARTQRGRHLKRKYGLTEEQYEVMVQEQRGECYICHESPERLYVDHCHATGRTRKLLCNRCNAALGMVREDPEILGGMIRYIEEEVKAS